MVLAGLLRVSAAKLGVSAEPPFATGGAGDRPTGGAGDPHPIAAIAKMKEIAVRLVIARNASSRSLISSLPPSTARIRPLRTPTLGSSAENGKGASGWKRGR